MLPEEQVRKQALPLGVTVSKSWICKWLSCKVLSNYFAQKTHME